MSFYAIRYEYADESNSSRQSATADPPLFKQEEEPFQNFVETCDDPSMHFQSPIPFENPELATFNASSHAQEQIFNPFDHHNYALNSYWQPKHDDQNTSSDQGRRWQHSERRHSLQSNSIYQQEIDNPYYSSDPSSQRNSFLFTEEDRENIAPGSSQFARKKHFENESSSESFDKDIQANRRVKMEPSPTYGNDEENGNFEYPYEADENDENLFGSKRIGKQDWPNSLNLEERNNVVIVRGSKEVDENVDFDEFVEDSTMSGSKTENTKEQQIAPNGFGKPAYSYSCLIGLSLKNSPTGELTVSEIYTFLCYHFPYFREAPSGWKNSVRHNLSLNKCFKKIEIETPGSHGRKSCLWTMNPARMVKMDQELNKWRERDEIRILNAMENPTNLDALQNGTMGMPPNMKPRRFSVIKNDKPALVVRASHNSKPLSSSFHASSTIQRDHPYTIQRGIYFHQNNRHQPIHNRQQQPKKIFQHQSHNESVHTQAARKLENLLKRQKTSTPLPFADGLPFYDGTEGVGGNNRKRSSTESCSSSSGHSSRRPTHQHSNVENQQKLFIGSKSVADRPAMTSKHCQFINQPAKLSRADREEQENAANFLYQQLYKNSSSNKEIANNDAIRNVKGKHQFLQTEPQCSHLLPHNDNELAIRIDQTLPNAPMVGFLQSSPFAVTSASLGLESCENALTQNPLLDPTLQ